MDGAVSQLLLKSLLQRLDSGERTFVSDLEIDAIRAAIELLGGEPVTNPAALTPLKELHVPQPLPKIRLALDSLQRDAASNEYVLLCLDFGTARSKAFANGGWNTPLRLELGTFAGGTGYTVPSSIFIDDDHRTYFGFEALRMGNSTNQSGRERIESIKTALSHRDQPDIDRIELGSSFLPPGCPTFTEGDSMRLYLAFLTDTACRALAAALPGVEASRYVLRRFARPCGQTPAQSEMVDSIMVKLLAQAQILADTFSGRWQEGISIFELKAAIEEVKNLDVLPDYLIDVGVAEPVAVAAGALAESDNAIDAYMVVDAGAGTTDFGLFFVFRHKRDAEPNVFQVTPSIQGLNQAGDKIDQYLHRFILSKEAYDPASPLGRRNEIRLRGDRRILKETLFGDARSATYALPDGTTGTVTLDEFLEFPNIVEFAKRLEEGFRKSLEAVDDSYLKHVSQNSVRLHVILTGGSSRLPFMGSLAKGYVEVRGFKIQRTLVDVMPQWVKASDATMQVLYPELAVCIGGAEKVLPSTDFGPDVFMRLTKPTFTAQRIQVSGI